MGYRGTTRRAGANLSAAWKGDARNQRRQATPCAGDGIWEPRSSRRKCWRGWKEGLAQAMRDNCAVKRRKPTHNASSTGNSKGGDGRRASLKTGRKPILLKWRWPLEYGGRPPSRSAGLRRACTWARAKHSTQRYIYGEKNMNKPIVRFDPYVLRRVLGGR